MLVTLQILWLLSLVLLIYAYSINVHYIACQQSVHPDFIPLNLNQAWATTFGQGPDWTCKASLGAGWKLQDFQIYEICKGKFYWYEVKDYISIDI